MVKNSPYFFENTPSIDYCGVDDRINRVKSRSIKSTLKKDLLRLALNMVDLTTLEGADTVGKVQQLCNKAKHPHAGYNLPTTAAVCVYPALVETAVKAVEGSPVKVASVSTAFPSGQTNLAVKLADTKQALEAGAHEIDMVIARGAFLNGNYNQVFDEIAAVKELCGSTTLKVILETGELGDLDNVRKASELAILAGADFIKTSTGKIGTAATLPVTYVMLQTIKDYYDKTGIKIAMKPAGGISDSKTALQYLTLVHEVLGVEWLSNQYFRFGASRLANDLIMQIVKQETGIYQSSDYFSKD